MIVGVNPELQNQGVGSATSARVSRFTIENQCAVTSRRANVAISHSMSAIASRPKGGQDTPYGGLEMGQQVNAKGTRQADDSVLATSVQKG